MDKFYITGLICFGLFVLMHVSENIADAIKTYSDKRNKENKAWNTKYTDAYFEDLVQRIESLQNDRTRNWKALNDIEILKGRLDLVDDWRQNALKGYCYKLIEFEKKKGKMHFLVVGLGNPYAGVAETTNHIEWIKSDLSTPQEHIKSYAIEITLEQATGYLEQGFVWVPTYEKQENWPVIKSLAVGDVLVREDHDENNMGSRPKHS